MANSVKITFAGDSSGFDKAAANVQQQADRTGKSLDGMKHHAESAGDGVERLTEGFEGGTKHIRGGRDAVDGVSTAMSGLGVAIPGPVGGVLTVSQGLADLSDGIATTVIPALSKLRVATLATLGPWGLAAVAVAALVAGFVIAYKKSETFRNIVNGVVKSVGDGFDWLVKHSYPVQLVFEYIKLQVDAAKFAITGAFKAIRAAWDSSAMGAVVDGLSKVVGFAGKVGGAVGGAISKGLGFHANGGVVSSGIAVVGERGPELLVGAQGSRVIPNNQLGGGGGGGQPIVIELHGDLVGAVRKAVRVQGGGNVQLAFGR